jgi:hypothetical protein
LSRGIATELLFDHLALDRGLVVSRPLLDVPYDRIVDGGGKLIRLQIKETSTWDSGSWWVQTSGRKKQMYVDSIDVMAIYVKPENAWVMFPASEITGSSARINLKGRHEKYINNWGIFYEAKQKDKAGSVPVQGAHDSCFGSGEGGDQNTEEV